MRRPGGRSNQPAVHMRLIDGDLNPLSPGGLDVRADGRVSAAAFAFEHPGCGKELRRVTDGCYGFVRFGKVTYYPEHVFVETKVFGRPPARDDKSIVISGFHLAKRCIQREVMARLFTVGLLALEVMYSS